MSESSSLIESLLYQSEGTALDFKCEQYPFSNATDEQKSELLKDVLAFANSWRQGDAYIVIGIEVVEGGRHNPVNIQDHFDDAQLQQFINGKTNRPIEMTYEIHCYEENKIGVIKIEKQERPFYAKKDYGKVKKEVVYYRMGSSTAIAKPEDIARMGKESVSSVLSPLMDLQFANPETRRELGTAIKLRSVAHAKPHRPLPLIEQPLYALGQPLNLEYWRQMEVYIRFKELFQPISLVIHNQSSILAQKVRVEIVGCLSDGINAKDICDLPEKPLKHIGLNFSRIRPSWETQQKKLKVKSYEDQWIVIIDFGDVQPKSSVWLDEPFYLGSKCVEQCELDALIFANNLPQPQKAKFLVDFEILEKEELTITELKKLQNSGIIKIP